MKKRNVMAAGILALSLCGCSSMEAHPDSALQRYLQEAEAVTVPAPVYHKEFYSYYAQPCIGRISAGSTSNVFSLDGHQFVMNLDVPSVLKEEGTEIQTMHFSGETETTYEGVFTDRNGGEHVYTVSIGAVGNRHCVYLQTDSMQFYSVSDITAAPQLAGEMLKIARSVEIDRSAIASYFRSSDGIDYIGETIELFDSITPENGSIEELFPDPVASEDFNQQKQETTEEMSQEETQEESEPDGEND